MGQNLKSSADTRFIFILLVAVMVISGNVLTAQEVYIESGLQGTENTPFLLKGEIFAQNPISQVLINYKLTGENEYKVSETEITGNEFTFTIPAEEVTPPEIEFFIRFTDVTGQTGYYPVDYANVEVPAKIVISSKPEFYDDVIQLNPIDETAQLTEDFFYSFSTFKLPDNINKSATKVIINGKDVTGDCVITNDIIVFFHATNPDVLTAGNNSVKMQFYNKDGSSAFTKSSVTQLRPAQATTLSPGQFYYNGQLQAEGRNENYNKANTWYNNLSGSFDANYNDIGVAGNFYVTSEEKEYRQPQNRFFAQISTEYGTLQAGDHFPAYPSLVYSGKRLRGVTGRVKAGFFELSVSYGQINRSIEGRLLELFPDNNTPLAANIVRVDSNKYGAGFARIMPGAFNRDLFVVRPVFNFSSTSKLGFTYLHSGDDPGSIEFGSQPKENLVFGPDLRITFDNSRIKFNSSAYISLQNNDISEGTIPDSLIEDFLAQNDIFGGDPDKLNEYKSIIDQFITVNQYLGPLNITELASLASDVELQFDYFNNTFKASYLYRGNDYNSFGKPFVRKDVAGFSFFDRLRLFENKVFLNVNYETLNDNLQKTKFNTTDIQNLNTSVSWFPRNHLPDITIGYKLSQNKNDVNPLDVTKRDLLIDDFTARYFLQTGYSFYTPVKQNVALRLSYSQRDDKSYRNYDTKVFNGGVNLNSRWSDSFQTYAGVSVNRSESVNRVLNYTRISVSGRWMLFENKLAVTGKVSPTFGDFSRTGFEIFGDYYFTEQLTLSYQLRYFSDFDLLTSSIAGVILKYNI